MPADNEVQFDRSLLGVEHHVGTFHVTREMLLSFASCTGESNPLFTDEGKAKLGPYGGLVAPPTFCNVLTSASTRPDIKLEFGNASLFAGQSIQCLAPVRPGDTLVVKTRLKDVYAKTGRSGKMVFIVWETSFTNQRGEAVALVQESYVRRHAGRANG